MPDYSNHHQRFPRVIYPRQCIRTSRSLHFHSCCPGIQDSLGCSRRCFPVRQGCSRSTNMTGIARSQRRSRSRSCPSRLYMSCRCWSLRERSQHGRLRVCNAWVCNAWMRGGDALTSAVIGSGVLVGAVLLALSTPYLRGGICDEKSSSSSNQSGSSVGKHVVMLHNSTI